MAATAAKIPHRVVAHALEQMGIDGKAGHAAEQHRVAVGRRPGAQLGAEAAARAGAIVDHDRLPELLAHPLGQDACDQIGRAAGWKRSNEADGLGRITLRPRAGDRQGEHHEHGKTENDEHGCLPCTPEPSPSRGEGVFLGLLLVILECR